MDKLREQLRLAQLATTGSKKICDLRMDIETKPTNVSVHVYGTLYAAGI